MYLQKPERNSETWKKFLKNLCYIKFSQNIQEVLHINYGIF